MLLKFRPFMTSKVWMFKDPDTKYTYKANNEKELLDLIISYRTQNELPPIEYLPIVVENYLCQRRVNLGACEPREPLKRGLFTYLKGGMALVKNLMFKKFVSLQEADRRARICVQCPLNVFPDKSGFVKWSDEVANASVGDRRSAYHNALGNCNACGCTLKAKVFYGETLNLSDKELEAMPEFCWQKQIELRERFTKNG